MDHASLPKTTVLRLVQTLQQAGMIQPTEGGRYVLGLGFLRWVRLAARSWALPPDIGKILTELAQRCEETVNVYVRHDIRRVCIAQHEGPSTLRHVVAVGDQLPLWGGAASKVLLADAPQPLLRRIARESPLGENHLTTLQQWVAAAAGAGHAVSHGERELGASSVAVPLRDRDGSVVAALTVGGPTARFTPERVATFLIDLVATAEVLKRRGFEHLPEKGPL